MLMETMLITPSCPPTVDDSAAGGFCFSQADPPGESWADRPVPWRHYRQPGRFRALMQAYQELHWTKKQDALACCGSEAYVERGTVSGRLRIRCKKCHLSTCPACSREKQANLASNLRYAMTQITPGQRIRFMTLTMKQSQRPLFQQIKRIQHCFRQLRRRPFFRKAAKQLVWVLEIKLGKKGFWNVHFHALLKGYYIDRGELSAAWMKITGDSPIVDIRSTNERAPVELTKYVSKQYDEAIFHQGNEDKLHEFLTATHRRRTIGVIGREWRDLRLTTRWQDPPDEPEEPFMYIGRLADIIAAGESGDIGCRNMIYCLLPKYWSG